jgi:hypothetical protein
MLSVGFIHFAMCGPEHLARALTSLAQQDLDHAQTVFYDNNSGTDPDVTSALIEQHFPRGFDVAVWDCHGEASKTHPYSLNSLLSFLSQPLVFVTRSDYILAPDAVASMRQVANNALYSGEKPFVSGWCYQAAYDRREQPYPPYQIDGLTFDELIDKAKVPGHVFTETDQDAGVWCSLKAYWEACPLNEQLHAWGYAQSTWQRQLRNEHGVTMHTIPRELFFHQQHGSWARDHAVARQQYEQFGGGR